MVEIHRDTSVVKPWHNLPYVHAESKRVRTIFSNWGSYFVSSIANLPGILDICQILNKLISFKKQIDKNLAPK